MVALVEYGIVACKIVDELVLPNKKGALCGDGIVDGGSEVTLGAVEGAYPATVNAQLQRSTASGEQVVFASAPTSCLREGPALTTAPDEHMQLPAHSAAEP